MRYEMIALIAIKLMQYSGSLKGHLRSRSEQYIPAPTPLVSFDYSVTWNKCNI